MNDNAVVIANLSDGSPVKVLSGIPVARGNRRGRQRRAHLCRELPSSECIIDNAALTQIGQVTTGNAPDGIAWDPSGHEPHVDGEPSLLLRHAAEQREVRGKHRANRRFTNPPVPLGTPLITFVMASSARLSSVYFASLVHRRATPLGTLNFVNLSDGDS